MGKTKRLSVLFAMCMVPSPIHAQDFIGQYFGSSAGITSGTTHTENMGGRFGDRSFSLSGQDFSAYTGTIANIGTAYWGYDAEYISGAISGSSTETNVFGGQTVRNERSSQINQLAVVSTRYGQKLGQWLVFGSVGGVVAKGSATTSEYNESTMSYDLSPETNEFTKLGAALGIGAETFLTDRLSFGVNLQHFNFSTVDYVLNTIGIGEDNEPVVGQAKYGFDQGLNRVSMRMTWYLQ